MPQILCPNPECQKSYRVSEDSLGGRARCKSCGTTFEIAFSDSGLKPSSPEKPSEPSTKNPNSDQTLPKQLGRYEIRGRLGQGGFGTVFRAFDPLLDREVALKIPRGGSLDSDEGRQRFLREPKAVAKLSHPNIVPVYDVGVAGTHVFIVSKLVQGPTLSEVLKKRELRIPRILDVIRKMAEALHYAHEQGIVHRDIKPSNIMLDEKGEPQLMDFGLAQLTESSEQLTRDGRVLGTIAYMSPEQTRGDHKAIGAASDQYSLGIVLYQLLTGKTPFEGNEASVIYQIRNDVPKAPSSLNPGVSENIDTICLRSIEKSPAKRYSSLDEMSLYLSHLLNISKPGSKKKSYGLGRKLKKARLPIGIGVVTLTIVVLAALLMLRPSHGTVSLAMQGDEAEAEILIDGKMLDASALDTPLELEPGEHKLEVVGEDVESYKKTFTVLRGQESHLNVNLVRKSIPEPKPEPLTTSDPKDEEVVRKEREVEHAKVAEQTSETTEIDSEKLTSNPNSELVDIRRRLQAIAISFIYYENIHEGTLPPGNSTTANRDLSWRVQLLPLLIQQPLYDRFDRRSAWDSEKNRPLLNNMPEVFQSGNKSETDTSFMVFTGANTLFPPEGPLGFRHCRDGAANTILAVCAGNVNLVPWTKPADIEFDPAEPLRGIEPINGRIEGVLCDGALISLPADIDPSTFSALVTPAGNDLVDGHGLALKHAPPEGLGPYYQIDPSLRYVIENRHKANERFRNIGRAALNYEGVKQKFPFAFQVHLKRDSRRRTESAPERKHELLSWRVAILPELEHTKLFKHFQLSKTWNSETNAPLLDNMPSHYRNESDSERHLTRVQAFTGRGTPLGSPGDRTSLNYRMFGDKSSHQVIMAIESGKDKAVPWTKPADLEFNHEDPLSSVGKISPFGTHAVMFDGSVRTITEDIDPEVFKTMVLLEDE